MSEEWRILVYDGAVYPQYEVSSLGRLRNRKGKVLKQAVNRNGYLGYCASLGHRGKNKGFRIHRAVACTFIPNPGHKTQVNHIDGDKQNNRVDNLEWVTAAENARHAWVMGLATSLQGEDSPHHKLDKKEVQWIRKNAREYGVRKTGERFGVSHSVISDILNGKSWKNKAS